MFVIYRSRDEAIITTLEQEHLTLKQFFGPNNRNVDEYDRGESKDCAVEVTASLRAD